MQFSELFEAPRTSLPLKKGVLSVARGSYGALIAVMRPQDFILLTTHDQAGRDAIAGHPFTTVDVYDKGPVEPNERGESFHKSQYNMPFLNVLYPSGQVVGHEGRHRANMILRANGRSFPVSLFFRKEYVYTVSYTQYDSNVDDDEGSQKVETFSEFDVAKQRKKELENLNKDHDGPAYFSSIALHSDGGNYLRGQPDRSDFSNWKYAAWKPTDMPPYLIGQFDQSVKVPTSRMAVGVIKGYGGHYDKNL